MTDYTFIDIPNRTIDGYYRIQNGTIQVFPFLIPAGMSSTLTAFQTGQQVQDFSLKMWISQIPLDQVLFTKFDNLNPIFLSGLVKTLQFIDKNFIGSLHNVLPLDSTLIYYANISNMAGKDNSYRILFPS